MENDKLVAKLKKHDEKALEQIIDRFTPIVSTIIFNISNGSLTTPDIEEVISDVFITLWNNADKVRADRLKGYICCIAKSKAKDKLRTIKSAQIIDIDDIDVTDDFSIPENIEDKILYTALENAIDNIKEPDKEIIIRHYYYYQSASVISGILNMNVETVKSKIRRTREKIRTYLEERGYTK